MKKWNAVRGEWVSDPSGLPPMRFRLHEIAEPSDLLSGLIMRAKRLFPREREIISLRLGIDSVKVATLPELGLKYGVSRNRIGQIEKAGLKKLGVELHRPPSQNYVTKILVSRFGGQTLQHEIPVDFGLRVIFVAIHGDLTLDNGAYI